MKANCTITYQPVLLQCCQGDGANIDGNVCEVQNLAVFQTCYSNYVSDHLEMPESAIAYGCDTGDNSTNSAGRGVKLGRGHKVLALVYIIISLMEMVIWVALS